MTPRQLLVELASIAADSSGPEIPAPPQTKEPRATAAQEDNR